MKHLMCLSFLWMVLVSVPVLAGQLTLDQAFDQTLQSNPTVQAMVQRINQAKEGVVQARAAYFPQFDLSAGASRKQISRNEDASSASLKRTTDYYDGFLSGKWVLFSGFSRKFTLEAAQLGQDLETASRADLIRKLLASVAASFHTAQLALANHYIADANQEFYTSQLETARLKQQAGVGSYSDVLNFNTRMNQARIEMERYQAEYDVARAALAALLGDDALGSDLPDPIFPEEEIPMEMEIPDPKERIAHAMDHRPDLAGLELSYKIAQANAEAARSKFYPELSLNGSVGADRIDSGRFESHDIENSVGLALSYPLYAGGKDRAALRQALYAGAEAELELKNLKNEVISQVRQDCFTVTAAQKQLRLYRENFKLVKENRDMVATEYQAGQTSQVNLNEVQNNLSETQQRIALSLISLRQAWYELKASSGSIYTQDEASMN